MYSRRLKESHRDTVSYEIDMLRFCAERVEALWGTGNDREGYLALFAGAPGLKAVDTIELNP